MMRTVGKTVTISQYVEIEKVVSKERILSILINPESKSMEVAIVAVDDSDHVLTNYTVLIDGENYDLLYDQNEIFSKGKQSGSYRETDLWKIIDLCNS